MGESRQTIEANTYQLVIKNLNNEGDSNSITLIYDSSIASQSSINNATLPFSCTLNDFTIEKEIYRPGKLSFTLSLDWKGNTINIKTIYTAFEHGVLQLTQGSGSDAFHIADNYYIFNIQLERPRSGTTMYARFEAYSPDKFLTLDKYCKAYTGQKFISDVFLKKANWPDAVALFTGQTDIASLVSLNLQFMTFVRKETVTNDIPASDFTPTSSENNPSSSSGNNTTSTTKEIDVVYEFIQPYLVQYNESFFDFIVRVTNRCGEYFFYEGNKFNVGLKIPQNNSAPSDAIQIENYISINFSQRQSSAWNDGTFSEVHQSYTEGKKLLSTEKASLKRDSHQANDDLLYPIPPKDKYSSWKDYAQWPEAFWISTVASALNEANLADILTQIVYQPVTTRISSQQSSDSANDDYKDSYFKGNYLGERVYDESGSGSDQNSTEDKPKSADEVDDKYGVYMFSSTPNGKDNVAYSLKFYADIQQGIEKTEQSRIHVVLENYFYKISLGSFIHFGDVNDSYIVVKINGNVKAATATESGEYFEFEAVPYHASEKNYPPSAHVAPICLSNPQRALITHNSDPLKLGRVRVRYPWQGDSDDPSPWIRIAQPMASKDSGFRFLPEKGDEAIINYENGNIEKPYVEGMLYSMQRPPAFGLKGSSTRVFSSVNGHSIIFSDPGGSTNLFKPFSSLWGTLGTYIPQMKQDIEKDSFRKAMGGIQFTDKYGLYSISMSSEKRTISINSPLGKVNINAFTGITISAPNGNVKIVGKNVDIVAGNNLTLTSGKNRDFLPKSPGDLGMKVVENVIGKFTLIDFATVRTVMETFLRPIAGTLRLSSKRYLCIEAGKGSTQIIGRKTVQNFELKKSFNPFNIKDSIMGNFTINAHSRANTIFTSNIPATLSALHQAITDLFNDYQNKCINILTACAVYDNACSSLQTLTVDLADYLTDTSIPESKAVFRKVQNQEALQPVEMKDDLPDDALPQTVTTIRDTVQVINAAATRLETLRYDENDMLNNRLQNTIVESDATLTDLVHNLCAPVVPEKAVDKNVTADAVARMLADKSIFRHIMWQALNYLVEHQKTEEGANYSEGIKKSGIGSVSSYSDDQAWVKSVNGISKESAAGSIAKKLVKEFVGVDKLDGIMDQYLWDTTDHGKVLLSDVKGKTLHIDQGAWATYMESRQGVDDIDHVIAQIKTTLHLLD